MSGCSGTKHQPILLVCRIYSYYYCGINFTVTKNLLNVLNSRPCLSNSYFELILWCYFVQQKKNSFNLYNRIKVLNNVTVGCVLFSPNIWTIYVYFKLYCYFRSPNKACLEIAQKFSMTKSFDLQRMYLNGDAHEYKDSVYGVTSIDVCGF